jgi:hypothetical protein
MSTLVYWSSQDEADFASSASRYATRASAELYLQSSLAYYKDQNFSTEQLTVIERHMRDILDGIHFTTEPQVQISGLQSGRVKKDPKTYSKKDWENLEDLCKIYAYVNIRVKGPDATRVLKLVEGRNKILSDNLIMATAKGKIKWDLLFEETCKG